MVQILDISTDLRTNIKITQPHALRFSVSREGNSGDFNFLFFIFFFLKEKPVHKTLVQRYISLYLDLSSCSLIAVGYVLVLAADPVPAVVILSCCAHCAARWGRCAVRSFSRFYGG